ncbi:uncharacterized protein LOC126844001 [Adelges cooleyi]|uniref:uncharacterized protein LOC126844001 n=1 Tax=Adelges cooleyi TaxID=133065 RepID=UPI00217FE796|nr:uncharacterized protein LOC126844001 [Adelges cooleyi]
MKNRKTDSNVAGSDDTENGSDEDIDVQNTSNIDQVTASSSQQPKKKRKKTQNFEETLIAALGSRQAREDPVSSFLMSLAPQIRGLEQVQQNQVFIEFLTVLQNIKYSNLPKQSNNPNLYHQSQTNISNSSLPPQNYSNVNYSYPVYPYNNFSSTPPSSSGLPLIPNPHLSPTISSSPLPPHLSASEYPSNSPNNTQYQNRPL